MNKSAGLFLDPGLGKTLITLLVINGLKRAGLHWQGGSYGFSEFIELMGDYSRSDAPLTLLDLIKQERAIDFESAGFEGISGDLLKRMLDEIDESNYGDHENWFPIFVASHHATGGSEEGLEVFDTWTRDDPKYEKRNVRYRWTTLTDRPDGITIATLFDELNELGKTDIVRLVQSVLEFQGVDAREYEPKSIDSIDYSIREVGVNDAIVASLSKSKNLFQRAGALVSISDNGISPVNSIRLCELTSEVCELVEKKKTAKGWKETKKRIPERVGRQIIARGSWFGRT